MLTNFGKPLCGHALEIDSEGVYEIIHDFLAFFVAALAQCLQQIVIVIPRVYFEINDVVDLQWLVFRSTNKALPVIALEYGKAFLLPAGVAELLFVGHKSFSNNASFNSHPRSLIYGAWGQDLIKKI